MARGLHLSSLRLVILALVIAQGDCQCQQNFDFPGGGFDQNHAIIYDIISTCLRCSMNSFTILVAGSGVSPAPLINSTSGVTILPPSGSEPEYTLMMPVPRDVLSNIADTIIGCTTGTNQEVIRFSELVFGDPVLNPNSTINVVEGTSGSLSCNPSPGTVSGIDARWTFGSTTLATSTDDVIYSYTNIMRSQSGVYNCTLKHSIGSGSAPRYIVIRSMAVTINVQFSPKFTDGLNSSCLGEGENLSLLSNLEAQPAVESFGWTKDGVAYQGDVSAASLNISNVSLGDAGVYNVTASNFLGSGSYVFTLSVISLSTTPRNLTLINLTDDSSTSIILRWQNPLVPAFNAFLVELVSMSPPFINVTRSFNAISTDPSYTNTFTVTGLKPNTSYTASVRAVSPQLDMSCMEQGVAHSQPSNTVAFMTMAGVPEFLATNLVNTNGKLLVTWSVNHTGGAPLTSVAVACRSEEEGSGSGLATNITSGFDVNRYDVGAVRMSYVPTGPEYVTAGMNYSCTITATNELGISERQTTNYILATSGVPSVPMITDVTAGIQLFIVTVRVFAGHTLLYFNTFVMNEQNSVVLALSDTQTGVPSGPMSYTIVVPFTRSGQYQFTVSVDNPFGVSDASKSDLYSFTGFEGYISTGVFVGAVVGLIAVILILVVLVAALPVLICKKKWREPDEVPSVENECGVLGGGVPQSIELKDNAAYSSVLQTQSAPHSQSIAVNDNVAYGTATEKTDPSYDYI